MSKEEILPQVRELLGSIGQRPITPDLQFWLEQTYPPGEPFFETLAALFRKGIHEGWACPAEIAGSGYRRGRIFDPSPLTFDFSVESALVTDRIGQHHRHPRGEINMIVPIDAAAQFCGCGRGWNVYPPGSEHFPTVTGGAAAMLYFLPNGELEFTGRSPDISASASV